VTGVQTCALPISPGELWQSWQEHRGETVVALVTAGSIVSTTLFEGVVIGLVVALAKAAWDLSHLRIVVDDRRTGVLVRFTGHATFLRVPKLKGVLDGIPEDKAVTLDYQDLRYYDRACEEAFKEWVSRQEALGRRVTLLPSSPRASRSERRLSR